MSRETRQIFYVAMALVSSFVFQAFAPRKVQTSRQTREAIEANEEANKDLREQQLSITEQQERIERKLLETFYRQGMLLENQRTLLEAVKRLEGKEP